jgi:hypothetical protein
MKVVIIESPLQGDYERNIKYARACVRDSLLRGESPLASHLLYNQPGILDDTNPEERRIGILAGLEWSDVADFKAVYTDLGISPGMKLGIDKAQRNAMRIEYRTLGGKEWETESGS